MGKGGCKPTSLLEKEILQNSTESASNLQEVSLSLLSTKNTVEECWIAYEGIVYDVTHWLPRHPGGIRAIMSAAGSESTAVMRNLHAPDTLLKFMKRVRKVGVLVPDTNEMDDDDDDDDSRKHQKERSKSIQKDFEILGEKLKQEGWYEPAPMTYWAPMTRAAAFLISGVSLALWTKEDSALEFAASVRWLALTVGSILIGLFLQNIAFMGHDAGHGSITGDFALDAKLGLCLGNFLTGIDMGWWKSTHNVHHSATNVSDS
jgi:delta8-fatty-acid desaturase